MFEVSKKYKTASGHMIYECLASCDGLGWLRYEDDDPMTFTWNDEWKEYVEPKVVKQELCVSKAPDGYIYTSTGLPDPSHIGRIRITYTEGSGIAVDVIG